MKYGNRSVKKLVTLGLIFTAAGLAGCMKDIVLAWDIPSEQQHCVGGTIYTDAVPGSPDLGGGSGIVDRNGGSGIVDRDGKFVSRYCRKPCAPTEKETGAPEIVIINDHEYVEAQRICVQ